MEIYFYKHDVEEEKYPSITRLHTDTDTHKDETQKDEALKIRHSSINIHGEDQSSWCCHKYLIKSMAIAHKGLESMSLCMEKADAASRLYNFLTKISSVLSFPFSPNASTRWI